MDDRRPPPLRNPSRTVAKFAVAVLILIAIAGFVLAGLRARAPGSGQAGSDPTQEAAPALTGAAAGSASAADDGVPLNQVVFAPASDRLSAPATARLQRLAESVRNDKRTIAIASKVESRADRAEQMELAKKRAFAVRQVLAANGVPQATMRIEIAEVPSGVVSAAEANRVDVVLR